MTHALISILSYLEIGTLVLLVGLSVWSVGIILDRWRLFKNMGRLDHLKSTEELFRSRPLSEIRNQLPTGEGLIDRAARALLEGPQSPNQLEPNFRSFLQRERAHFEKGLGILATLGSNAPFIGLFGTVLGIIEAFSALSTEQAGSNVVMSNIATALVATAAGLFVAIPAVVAFNAFSSRLRHILLACESLKNLYLSRLPDSHATR